MTALANDLEIYERHGDEWWDDASPVFRSLRSAKAFQLEQIVAGLATHLGGRFTQAVDLGCGGGLLAVPLAAHGDLVVGVDRSATSLAAAREAARRRGAACVFLRHDIADVPLEDGCADLVVLSDVIEHVSDKAGALAEATRLVRPGGLVYVNTLARTLRAKWLAVVLAEGIGLVPRGTHDARLFISSDELTRLASATGLELLSCEGEAPLVLRSLRTRTIHLRRARSTAVAYHAFYRRTVG